MYFHLYVFFSYFCFAKHGRNRVILILPAGLSFGGGPLSSTLLLHFLEPNYVTRYLPRPSRGVSQLMACNAHLFIRILVSCSFFGCCIQLVMCLRVCSCSQDVIRSLLKKFKVADNPHKYALYEKCDDSRRDR